MRPPRIWDTSQTNLVAPTAGQIANGWATGDHPTSGNFNYLHYWIGQWAQYLANGAFSGASTFDNTLGVTGLITATGGISVPSGATATIQSGGTLSIASGGTLSVPGTATFTGGTTSFGASVATDITLATGHNVIIAGAVT